MRWRRAVDIRGVDHFDLAAVMDSGQLFRWRPLSTAGSSASVTDGASNGGAGDDFRLRAARAGDAAYVGVVAGRVWSAHQRGRRFWCDVGTGADGDDGTAAGGDDVEDDQAAVRRYFDLDTDYAAVADRLYRRDPALRPALRRRAGLRLVRQQPWEALVTFILSSNNNMPRIRMLVDRLARAFGAPIGAGFHRFPPPSALAAAGEAELRGLGTGYRAPYVAEAARRVEAGELDLERLKRCPAEEAREALMALPGVGRKVADCVLLFGLDKRDVFPLDVWAKRAVERVYFGGEERKLSELQAFVAERFGRDAGHAQNYLFNDVRLRGVQARAEGGSGDADEASPRRRGEDAESPSVRRE